MSKEIYIRANNEETIQWILDMIRDKIGKYIREVDLMPILSKESKA